MYVRVVRFTDVDEAKMSALTARVEASGGPPPGVETVGLDVLFDAAQGTAVVLQRFATAEAMAAAEAIFDGMDASETPGTRTSIDRCAVSLAVTAPA